jgi:hypothetical protein
MQTGKGAAMEFEYCHLFFAVGIEIRQPVPAQSKSLISGIIDHKRNFGNV